jgi:hypothetical protein
MSVSSQHITKRDDLPLNFDPFASFLVPEISLNLGVESLKL